MVLEWTDIGGVTIEALTHLENTRCLSVLTPELLGHFWDGIDSNTVELVLLDGIFNPVLELLSNPIVVLVQIWQTGQSAMLD